MSEVETRAKTPSFWRVFTSRRMWLAFLMGFLSGLPLLLTGSTLQAWMREAGVDLTTIGFMSLVGVPYTFKFVWAPIFDRMTPRFLGRRRGWLVVMQLATAGAIALLGMSNPVGGAWVFAGAAFLVTFFSASQDIVFDAYRRESLSDEELGLGSSLFVNGYRIAMWVSSAGALLLAEVIPWRATFFVMAVVVALGVLVTLLAEEPKLYSPPPRSMREAIVEPLVEYFRRPGAIEILAFIFLYKLGESLTSAMTVPMYLDLGFTKTEIAEVVKSIGIAGTLAGGFFGGVWMLRLGIPRALMLFGVLQTVTTLGFSALASAGHSLPALAAVICSDNFTAGMATSAYVAYMGSLTDRRFTATQYALLSSFMGLPRVFAAAPSGWVAHELGWVNYYVFCTVAAVPGLLLLHRLTRSTMRKA